MDTKTYCAAALLAALIASGPAAAQSLTLSYKLESRSEPPREAPAPIGRCAGFNWLTAIEACGRDLLARIVPPRGEAQPAPSAQSEVPELGAAVPYNFPRSSGAVVGNARAPAPDVMLRLGSKARMRANEDGTWDQHRFTDMNYESYVRNNSLKAVGVELHVPFQ